MYDIALVRGFRSLCPNRTGQSGDQREKGEDDVFHYHAAISDLVFSGLLIPFVRRGMRRTSAEDTLGTNANSLFRKNKSLRDGLRGDGQSPPNQGKEKIPAYLKGPEAENAKPNTRVLESVLLR
jgi:hypothetical protein